MDFSVSKGCFVFKNGATAAKLKKKNKKVTINILGDEFNSQSWYMTFKAMWNSINSKIENLHTSTYEKILKDLVEFVRQSHDDITDAPLPSATLLTGINQPDHGAQFASLARELRKKVTPHVATLLPRDCPNVKATVESMVLQFVNETEASEDEDNEKLIKKSQSNIQVLKSWYCKLYPASPIRSPKKKQKIGQNKKPLVVVIPDFESFNANVLQDFILILSGHCPALPIVLIFGVATALSAVHRALPYHVTSKLAVQVFHSQPSNEYLKQVLEEVILSPDCPFHLSGKAFTFLTDVFLFYDFSVQGFIQGFKYCMMQHYFAGNHLSLCCPRDEIKKSIKSLTHKDLEEIRHLMSFRTYVEKATDSQEKINLITNDDYLKLQLPKLMNDIHYYFQYFHLFLNILYILIGNLPRSPLGRQIRDLYTLAISTNIIESQEYKECVQLLNFLSKDEFVEKLLKVATVLKQAVKEQGIETNIQIKLLEITNTLDIYIDDIKQAGLDVIVPTKSSDDDEELFDNIGRLQMREKLLQLSKSQKPISKYEEVRSEVLVFITENMFKPYIYPLNNKNGSKFHPFFELFLFSDIASVKNHIVGTPRAGLHTALNNPNFYLQCKCCHLSETDSILPTMPDICIAYKLHLECGKLINLFDWLQAFRSVIIGHNEDDESSSKEIEPEIQARFTRCVAELQHLGYIKSSNRKTDHVTRLTW